LLFFAANADNRPIKIFMYQYIPDLNGDFYAGLVKKLQDRFYIDTGLNVSLTYSYDYDTYAHETMGTALSSGGFDMAEADASAICYLAENHYIIPIPHHADTSGFTDGSIEMSTCHNALYMFPSYSCVNVMMSYDADFPNVNDADELVSFLTGKLSGHPEKIGWGSDISNVWDIRYAYMDGWLDSNPQDPLYPGGYSADLDSDVVSTLQYLRDTCVDRSTSPHSNPCVDSTYFFNTDDRYFGDFSSGRMIVLQGFPEYVSNILAENPTVPYISTAHLGSDNENFIYTNGFVISKSNCDHQCMGTAITWLNWSKVNHGLITSLGLDLVPPRPRYLLWSWQPFYQLPQVTAYPLYHKFWTWQRKAQSQNILHLLDTQDAQQAALNAALIDGYTPP